MVQQFLSLWKSVPLFRYAVVVFATGLLMALS